MKMQNFTLTLACVFSCSGVYAAAMDRSGQSISSFLQPNNYFEAGMSYLDPDVSGKDNAKNSTGNMAEGYAFANAAIKLQATDHISFGFIYDQPFGADTEYKGTGHAFVPSANNAVLPIPNAPTVSQLQGLGLSPITGSTSASVKTQNLSAIVGFQPNESLNFYGGVAYQTVKGDVSLRGNYAVYNGYDAKLKETGDIGWLVGAAFQIPEIALKASITYRSEIEHDIKAQENLPIIDFISSAPQILGGLAAINPNLPAMIGAGLQNLNSPIQDTRITTPQSVNLDLQTGIMANTIAFANIRWVDWSNISIRPHRFGQVSQVLTQLSSGGQDSSGFNLIDYSKDQWSINTGIGRKVNDQWSGAVSVGYDSGAGNPVTALGPTEGYWNVGLNAQFSPAPNYFVAGGVKYFWLGDAHAKSGNGSILGEFQDNDALAYGVKMGYRF